MVRKETTQHNTTKHTSTVHGAGIVSGRLFLLRVREKKGGGGSQEERGKQSEDVMITALSLSASRANVCNIVTQLN